MYSNTTEQKMHGHGEHKRPSMSAESSGASDERMKSHAAGS